MRNFVNISICVLVSLFGFSALSIEYGQYTCETEEGFEDPDSFPLGIYQDYIQSPEYDGSSEKKFPFSVTSDDYIEQELTGDDISDGLSSIKYNAYRLSNGNIMIRFIYDYGDEVNTQVYSLKKVSDIQFEMAIESLYGVYKDYVIYICTKQKMHLS